MTLPPYLADKNSLIFRGYKMCIEFMFDKSDPDPANWLYFRKARYDQNLTVLIDQLGNPSADINVTFYGGSPIGDTEITDDMSAASSQSQIILPNAAREINAICEFYDLTGMPGRLLWVHPDYPGDGAVTEAVFQIEQFAPAKSTAVLTVSPYSFDPTTKMIPEETISADVWPGVAGIRAVFLV
jgi:hypothetical protein